MSMKIETLGMEKWTKRFLNKAKEVSEWSKDPSSQVGVITVNENRRTVSEGYNGFPKGIADTEERLTNREEKYKYVVHGEMNCIYNACLEGQSLKDTTMYIHARIPMCSKCALAAVSVGVGSVVMRHERIVDEKWQLEWELAREILDEAGIFYKRFDMNDERIA